MPRTRADKDYYEILGVATQASEEEIRRAYRRLALQWHPDRNAGRAQAAERFKEISEAYAILIDPTKRRAYEARRQAGAGGFRPRREDLFRDLFADPQASAIFEDLAREFERLGLRIDRQAFHKTLFEGRAVVSGGVFLITPLTPALALGRVLRALLGGGPAASVPEGGQGRFARALRIGQQLLGLRASRAGADVSYPLRLSREEAARGGPKRLTLEGEHRRDEVVVTIPAGIRSGTRLRLRGKGRPAAGGVSGDAYLIVEVLDS